jgi:hypothetical protein
MVLPIPSISCFISKKQNFLKRKEDTSFFAGIGAAIYNSVYG